MSGCFLLCFQGWPLVDSLVESASAIGTVGLSRNLTPQLDVISQWVVMLLMYGGRVGSLSVVLAFSPSSPKIEESYRKSHYRIGKEGVDDKMKSFLVIGLGRFGSYLAKNLSGFRQRSDGHRPG